MRAITFSTPGGPEVLQLTEVPDPTPGPEQLLVRVRASALNRADTLQRRGQYPPPPGESDLLGLELAGEVEAVGPATQGLRVGDHKSPYRGFSVEFVQHREYVPGDDPKHIDWRLYFKRDKYFIKQYEMETNFVCHLVLDVSASMRYGDSGEQKLLYAAQMAMALGYSIIRQSDKVSLFTFDDRVRDGVPPRVRHPVELCG
jgi:uncharacterized protein (DUF58 family)